MDLEQWWLTCPVHWLHLRTVESHPDIDFREMRIVLQERIRPAVLSLHVFKGCSNSWAQLIDNLPDTKCLEIVTHHHDKGEMPYAAQINLLQTELSLLLARQNIMCIQIYLDPFMTSPTWFLRPLNPRDRLSSSDIAKLDVTMAATAHRLACSIPSLKYIALGWRQTESDAEMDFARVIRSSWWRVVGSGAGRAVEPISMERGEWVSARMRTPGCDFGAL
ncbi:hypothetical protein BKA93DRAFT_449007 [Sparassis latifolia]